MVRDWREGTKSEFKLRAFLFLCQPRENADSPISSDVVIAARERCKYASGNLPEFCALRHFKRAF
jgi:hypothetical protein